MRCLDALEHENLEDLSVRSVSPSLIAAECVVCYGWCNTIVTVATTSAISGSELSPKNQRQCRRVPSSRPDGEMLSEAITPVVSRVTYSFQHVLEGLQDKEALKYSQLMGRRNSKALQPLSEADADGCWPIATRRRKRRVVVRRSPRVGVSQSSSLPADDLESLSESGSPSSVGPFPLAIDVLCVARRSLALWLIAGHRCSRHQPPRLSVTAVSL